MKKTLWVIGLLILLCVVSVLAYLILLCVVSVLAYYPTDYYPTIRAATQECEVFCDRFISVLPDVDTASAISDKNTYMQDGRCKCEYLVKPKIF